MEGQRDFAAFRLENHVRSANAGKPSAMRLRSFDRQRRVDANIPPGESLVVGGTKQRAVQAGRTYFERIRIRKRAEIRSHNKRSTPFGRSIINFSSVSDPRRWADAETISTSANSRSCGNPLATRSNASLSA